METVIMRPFSSDMDGIAEYSVLGGRLKLKYSIKRRDVEDNRIYKLVLLSSVKPSNSPVIADTPEFKGQFAFGSKVIASATLCVKGYNAEDIDTFALVLKEDENMTLVSVGFSRLCWEVQSVATALESYTSDPALTRARNTLESLKKTANADTYRDIIGKLESLKNTLTKSDLNPHSGYEWYELYKKQIPLKISSFEHVLTDRVFDITAESGGLLLGIGNSGATALASVDEEVNPFENASDCSVRRGRFWIVGIRLKEDGQYFERLS